MCWCSPAAAGRPANGTVRRMIVPCSGARAHSSSPPTQLGALAHAGHSEPSLQPVAARAEPRRVGQAAPIVGHRRVDRPVACDHANHRLRRLCVTADVRERLLDDSVDRALELGVQPPGAVFPFRGRCRGSVLRVVGNAAEVDLRLDFQPVDRLRAPGERLERGRQPEIVERRRAQLGDQVAQAVDLCAKTLERRVDGRAQRILVVQVTGVGELQAQSADALDALVVDLARPACTLALPRLHAVAQTFDLDGALGRQTLGDARREGAQRLPVGLAEASLIAQHDHQAGAVRLHVERLDQHRAGLESEFVQPRRLLAAGAIERHGLALEVQRPERGALHGRDPQPHRRCAAARRDTQLAALLDHHEQRARVEQRQAAVGHQPQQPQL